MHSNAGDTKGSKRLTEFSVQDGSKGMVLYPMYIGWCTM